MSANHEQAESQMHQGSQVTNELLQQLLREIERQDRIHPAGYPPTRDGIYLGIKTAADEELNREALEAWREGRCKCPTPNCDHHKWSSVEMEVMQAAAVLVRLLRSIELGERERLADKAAASLRRFGPS